MNEVSTGSGSDRVATLLPTIRDQAQETWSLSLPVLTSYCRDSSIVGPSYVTLRAQVSNLRYNYFCLR